MQVHVISDTIQEFNGERFYLCGNYFQHKGKRLHVTVWKYHNGDIPKGYHVHHMDENRSNNQIENLCMVEASLHVSRHSSSRVEYNQKHIKEMQDQAKEWHRSAEGREWHSKKAKEQWADKKAREYTCSECGKKFFSMHDYADDQNIFCSNACKTKHRVRSGVDNVVKVCAYCGKKFVANKYARAKCCSRECGVKMRWGK